MITFPTTVEAFIADQEKRAGRKFDDFQRELLGEYAELFNLEFDAGMKGEEPSNVLKDTAEFYARKASWKSWKSLYLNTSMRVCSIGAAKHGSRVPQKRKEMGCEYESPFEQGAGQGPV